MRLNFHEEHPYFRFPYRPPLPMIPLTLYGPRGQSIATYGLLDTGAEQTVLHAKWAMKAGIDWLSGRPGQLIGIEGGKGVQCHYRRVNIKIGSFQIRCDVAFSDSISDEIDNQLVGRATIFDMLRFAFRQRVEKFYVGSVP